MEQAEKLDNRKDEPIRFINLLFTTTSDMSRQSQAHNSRLPQSGSRGSGNAFVALASQQDSDFVMDEVERGEERERARGHQPSLTSSSDVTSRRSHRQPSPNHVSLVTHLRAAGIDVVYDNDDDIPRGVRIVMEDMLFHLQQTSANRTIHYFVKLSKELSTKGTKSKKFVTHHV